MSNKRKISGLIGLLDRALTWVSLICGGVTLVFMTGFSVWNVLIMRKALNAPIVGAEDLLILSLVVIVALSIPLGARTGAHIEIETLESRMSARFAKWSMISVKLLGVALLVLLAWRLWHAGQSAVRFGEAMLRTHKITQAELGFRMGDPTQSGKGCGRNNCAFQFHAFFSLRMVAFIVLTAGR